MLFHRISTGSVGLLLVAFVLALCGETSADSEAQVPIQPHAAHLDESPLDAHLSGSELEDSLLDADSGHPDHSDAHPPEHHHDAPLEHEHQHAHEVKQQQHHRDGRDGDDDEEEQEEEEHASGQSTERPHRQQNSQTLLKLLYEDGEPPMGFLEHADPKAGNELHRRHGPKGQHEAEDEESMEVEVSDHAKNQHTYDKGFNYGHEERMQVSNKESKMNQLKHKLSPRKFFRKYMKPKSKTD